MKYIIIGLVGLVLSGCASSRNRWSEPTVQTFSYKESAFINLYNYMLVNQHITVNKSMMKKIMDYVQQAGMERRCGSDNKCYLYYHNKKVVLTPEYIIIGSVKVKTPEEAVRYIYN